MKYFSNLETKEIFLKFRNAWNAFQIPRRMKYFSNPMMHKIFSKSQDELNYLGRHGFPHKLLFKTKFSHIFRTLNFFTRNARKVNKESRKLKEFEEKMRKN